MTSCKGRSHQLKYQQDSSHQASTILMECPQVASLWHPGNVESVGVGCDMPRHICSSYSSSATSGQLKRERKLAKYAHLPSSYRDRGSLRSKDLATWTMTRACHWGSEIQLPNSETHDGRAASLLGTMDHAAPDS